PGAGGRARTRGRSRRDSRGGRLPEGGRLERALELLERPRVDARAEVLPAVVGDDEDHVALVELVRRAHRDRGHGTRRDADEQALLGEQLLGPDDSVTVGDEDLAV